jgi:hypothetical protein
MSCLRTVGQWRESARSQDKVHPNSSRPLEPERLFFVALNYPCLAHTGARVGSPAHQRRPLAILYTTAN